MTRGKGVAGRRWAGLAGSCERLEREAGQMGWGAMDARTVASRAWRKVFVLEVAGALDKGWRQKDARKLSSPKLQSAGERLAGLKVQRASCTRRGTMAEVVVTQMRMRRLAILWWPRVGFHLPVTKCVVSVFCIVFWSVTNAALFGHAGFGEGP